MGFPDDLLDEGETVVLDLHPHWRVVVLPVLSVPVVVGIAVFVAVLVGQTVASLVVAGVALVVLLVTFLRPFVRWRTTHYVMTDRRVVIRTGLVARNGRDVPLSRVNDVTFNHTAVERLFGSGTLTVESAGEHGQVVLADIPHVEHVQRTLTKLVEQDGRRQGTPA